MSDIAICVENLSKAYRIGLKEQRHETLMGALASVVRAPLENFRNVRKLSRFGDAAADAEKQKIENGKQKTEGEIQKAENGKQKSDSAFQLSTFNSQLSSPADMIWALKDVSFDVKHGEVLGIIGRNGAGKSTLLKILARITEPTSGRATIYGRVGSLLEVGTGFHPDLTGRENVYLNGTILGMSKKEVDNKFDEIVAFSEVEKFIDTPVKRYSSGMRMRLAFSVAAHLDPEILIVDEVLAVGDLSFQTKCLGKMGEVAQQGRTVLFVSHNMSAILELCARCIVLEAGSISFTGLPAEGIERYVGTAFAEQPDGLPNGNHSLLSGVQINQSVNGKVSSGSPFHVSTRVEKPLPNGSWVYLIMEDFTGRTVFHKRVSASEFRMPAGRTAWRLSVSIPALWLAPGIYSIYFKVLFAGLAEGSQRRTSERLPVEVNGELDNSGKAILNPVVGWNAS